MTVIDEMHGSDEYADMEFVELLEFIVRYAFVMDSSSQGDGLPSRRRTPIHKLVEAVVQQMLQLVDMQYINPPV